MDKSVELNKELKDEINLTLTSLLKEIGNSRQQLYNKVLSFHTEIHKELTKNKIDTARQTEIRNEVNRTVKMAHQQLPHLKFKTPIPATALKTLTKSQPVNVPTPVPKAKAKPATKPSPAAKKKK